MMFSKAPLTTIDDHANGSGSEAGPPKTSIPPTPPVIPSRDPYRIVVLVLLVLCLLGTAAATAAGRWLGHVLLLDLAVTLGLAASALITVALTQIARSRPDDSR